MRIKLTRLLFTNECIFPHLHVINLIPTWVDEWSKKENCGKNEKITIAYLIGNAIEQKLTLNFK